MDEDESNRGGAGSSTSSDASWGPFPHFIN